MCNDNLILTEFILQCYLKAKIRLNADRGGGSQSQQNILYVISERPLKMK